MQPSILIVDDEVDIAELIQDILSDEQYTIFIAHNRETSTKILSENKIDLVLLDIWIEGQNDGIELLKEIKNRNSSVQVIMISGNGNIEIATKSLKLGAYDYIEKPFNSEKLKTIARNCLENQKLKTALENKDFINNKYIEIIGESKIMQNVRNLALEASQNDTRVFLSGEIGVGKKLIGRYIHKNSHHCYENFTIINNSNHEIINNIWKFLENYHGTVFFHEIAEFPIYFQKNLLSIINAQNSSYKSTFRIISSSSKNPKSLIELNLIDGELYERLKIMYIEIPPLRNRISDIALLCEFFIKYFVEFSGVNDKVFSEDAINKLQSYDWDGNVEQLKKIIEWILIYHNFSEGNIINSLMISSLMN